MAAAPLDTCAALYACFNGKEKCGQFANLYIQDAPSPQPFFFTSNLVGNISMWDGMGVTMPSTLHIFCRDGEIGNTDVPDWRVLQEMPPLQDSRPLEGCQEVFQLPHNDMLASLTAAADVTARQCEMHLLYHKVYIPRSLKLIRLIQFYQSSSTLSLSWVEFPACRHLGILVMPLPDRSRRPKWWSRQGWHRMLQVLI